MKRCIIMVLDSFGIGELPDAAEYGDEGTNTLAGIYNNTNLNIPNMKKLGLYNIDEVNLPEKEEQIEGAYGKAAELSKGKNSPVGHWEIAGFVKETPFITYPNAFPEKLVEEFKEKTGLKGILGNEVASGTEILQRLGEEHLKTGYPIIYTSADSVFQIAAHEDIIPVERLYEICLIAREILDKPEYNMGTVIARPFLGTNKDNFKRTYNRKDFEANYGTTMLDIIKEEGKDIIAIGKIEDLFVGRGITKYEHTSGNVDGIEKTIEAIKKDTNGLIFTNLVDFDMLYGHRRDIVGYARGLEEFDSYLPEILENMKEDDMLIITADHGCDPSYRGTDHTREYIPILIAGEKIKKGTSIGTRKTFADISATILDIFSLQKLNYGESFKNQIL